MSMRFACASLLALLASCGGGTGDKSDASTPLAGADAALPAGVDAAVALPPDASVAGPPDAGATVGTISPDDLNTILNNGTKDFLLINVHTPHVQDIPGTDTFIPYTDTDALAAYIGANLDTRAVVYCMSNSMSGTATKALAARGYTALRILNGGMGAWQAAGYPLVRIDAGP
jgi:rhodanese-related sulfurtransferase